MPEPIITFEARTGWYGLKARDVREIAQLRGVRPVPRAPALFAGLAEVHGRIVTLVDLEQVVGAVAGPSAESGFSVVLSLPFDHLGILVRTEVGVATPDEAAPEESEDKGALLYGRVLIGDRLLNLLCLPALVARLEESIREGFRPRPRSDSEEDGCRSAS